MAIRSQRTGLRLNGTEKWAECISNFILSMFGILLEDELHCHIHTHLFFQGFLCVPQFSQACVLINVIFNIIKVSKRQDI